MREKNKARLGETKRLESASSQRQSNALKLGFREVGLLSQESWSVQK